MQTAEPYLQLNLSLVLACESNKNKWVVFFLVGLEHNYTYKDTGIIITFSAHLPRRGKKYKVYAQYRAVSTAEGTKHQRAC